MNAFIRLFVVSAGVVTVYRNRYRIMNKLLAYPSIRKIAVRSFMGIPGVRERIMFSAFR